MTEYAGDTPGIDVSLPTIDDLASATPGELVRGLDYRRCWGDAQLSGLLARFLLPPADVPPGAYYECLRVSVVGDSCGLPTFFDAAGFVAAANATIHEPRATAQAFIEGHAYTTRLYTELSAPEMTLDPEFVLDRGLATVSQTHRAVTVTECGPDYYLEGAPIRVYYDSGGVDPVREGTLANPTNYCTIRGGWIAGTMPPGTPGGGGSCSAGAAPHAPALSALGLLAILLVIGARRAARPLVRPRRADRGRDGWP